MGRLSEILKDLDLLAPDISLNHKGGGGVRTVVGSVIWILCTGVFLGAIAYFLWGFLRTDQPNLEYQYELLDDYPRIDMATSRRVPIIFGYLDEVVSLNPEEFSRYATPVFRVEVQSTQTAPNGTLEYQYTDKIMKFIPCSDLFQSSYTESLFPSKSNKFLYETVRDYGWCVNWTHGQVELFGKTVDPAMGYASFSLVPCMLQEGCATAEELKRFSIVHSVGEEVLKYGDSANPVTFAYNGDDYVFIDPALMMPLTHKLMTNEIWDDKGLFFANELRASYTSIQKSYTSIQTRNSSLLSCTEEMLKDFSCTPYIQHWYISGGAKAVTVRSYIGILDWLSNIGGVREILYFVGFLFYMVYNSNKKKEELVSHIYDFDPSDIVGKLDPNFSKAQSPASTTQKCGSATSRKRFLIEKAYDQVEQSLDVVNLLKTLQTLKVFGAVLLADHQRVLIPVASLKQELSSDLETSFNKGNLADVGNDSQMAANETSVAQTLQRRAHPGTDLRVYPSRRLGSNNDSSRPWHSNNHMDANESYSPPQAKRGEPVSKTTTNKQACFDAALETLSKRMLEKELASWDVESTVQRNHQANFILNFQNAVDEHLFRLLAQESTIPPEPVLRGPPEPGAEALQQTRLREAGHDESSANCHSQDQTKTPPCVPDKTQVLQSIANLMVSKSKPT